MYAPRGSGFKAREVRLITRGMNVSSVRRFGIVGAGQMGRGIAQVAAAAGFDVILSDVALSFAEGGKNCRGLYPPLTINRAFRYQGTAMPVGGD